jgi:aldehyde:ferredoxin oxidoreductase
MAGGYIGKVLRIDLTTQRMMLQTFSDETLRSYIGGSGLGARILYDETTNETDPLGPDNRLIFLTGPLVGTRALNFGRYHIVTRSPLTGLFGEANSGGSFGPAMKRSGYDGFIVTGKSESPVYLFVDEGKAELRDATRLWGKDTYEVDALLKAELGDAITTCSIGQGGENLVRFAAIMNDGVDGRCAARCGVGAVMGSKKLKAIALRGTLRPLVADDAGLKASVKHWAPIMRKNTEEMGLYGTSGGAEGAEAVGELPVRNWTAGRFAGAEKISGRTMASTILKKRFFCSQCVIGCGRTIHVKEGLYQGVEGGGPEYETVGMLGSNCMVQNLEAVAKANELCNRWGIDTISTGSAIGFAMEAYERGLITQQQTGGLAVTWGDPDVLIAMVRKIAFREDIGYLLGEGIQRAAAALGGTAPEFAVHVRGLDFPAHDPRHVYSTGLQYATSARGACHLSAFTHDFDGNTTMPELGYSEPLDPFDPKGKGEFVAKFQNLSCQFDSLTGCKFSIYGLTNQTIATIVQWLNMVTGWDVTADEFLETGSRIFNLKRMYNVRLGQSRKDDVLPPRILTHMRGEGGSASTLPPLGLMLSEFYAYRGWDEFGIPKKETLEKLGLAGYSSERQ